jgi:hypothetical protein
MKVKLTFIEPLLGTLSGNKQVAEDFIVAKHPDGMSKDEMDALIDVPEALQKASTYFSRFDEKPHLWDYQVKGFFKGGCAALISTGEWTKEALKKFRLTQYLYKKTIDQLVFVYPRIIPLDLAGDLTFIERPLRAETIKGERIALARSEAAPVGTAIEIEVRWLNDNLEEWIRRCLDYGELVGLGQWRNGSYGRFTWEELQ